MTDRNIKLFQRKMTEKNFSNLDWTEVVDRIKSQTTSLVAREQLGELSPLASENEALKSFEDIFSAAELLGTGVRPFMQSLDTAELWRSRLKKSSVLQVLELRDLRSFCLEVIALREATYTLTTPWSQEVSSSLMKAEEPLSAIDQLITPSGEIRSDASETLHRLHQEKEHLERDLNQTLDHLIKDHEMESFLQDRFVTTREGRWVVPVKSGMKNFLPGVVHGSSQSKQTVFMEPEKIIPLNNRLKQVHGEIEEEIERLLKVLSDYLATQFSELQNSFEILLKTDICLAKAQFGKLTEAGPIQFSQEEIALDFVRHPLLHLSGKEVIPNSVRLDSNKSILLLSGPNAGGKTVLLKSIGLCAHMARCGLLVCAAPTSHLPFFDRIWVAIGDAQNVDAELSTFAAHLKFLNESALAKGKNQLILVDEICGSTDPEEGAALARSFIESFSQNEVFGIITSHLSQLKSQWEQCSRILSGSMEYSSKTGLPTYNFIPGIAGDSLALLTAKRVGVPETILERARTFLSPESRARMAALEEVENMKHQILDLQRKLQNEIQESLAQKREYERMKQELERDKEKLHSKALKNAEKKVDEAIAHAKVDQSFRRHENLYHVKNQMPKIIRQSGLATSEAEAKGILDIPHQTAQDFAKHFPPGSKVFVSSLNQDGIIQSEPNSRGEVLVISGSMRLQVPWNLLQSPQKPQNPTAKLVRQSGSKTMVSFQEQDRVLDMRGKRSDAAIEELESALDLAVRNRESRIRIIHGFGTEALKKAIRSHLSRSVFVKKWQSAPSDQGGDGATWVEVNLD